MPDEKKKHVTSFGKGRKRKRLQLRQARAGQLATVAVAAPPVNRTPAINFGNREEVLLQDYFQGDRDDSTETAGDITTVITRSSVLSTLVKGLRCLECGAASLVIRVADHRLGLVAAMETVCTECDSVLNSTLTSDRMGHLQGMCPSSSCVRQ
ncbi:hypothetical protein NP493_89g04065 [Ridgeia piscesae]|uniref:Uncharacterized protein n=1 Tax=Ridgeia piscesae TaxID=27915 RepID=A0AAD9UHT9_RIDPI|nr:hypothetical protein NP493_89g04065 [Ridgeia piscesae]